MLLRLRKVAQRHLDLGERQPHLVRIRPEAKGLLHRLNSQGVPSLALRRPAPLHQGMEVLRLTPESGADGFTSHILKRRSR